ncbi:hypothetical protein [Lentzea kentuckyensis]|uniref:hypothetical protein n=1 Tax=Lentzea kentuckyensis TaxID=360086 RepID=UPI0013024627|nr:hypothetical protein [Lentzea kentuckyensis]
MSGQRCGRSGRYRMKEHSEVIKYISEGDLFPRHNGARVTWLFDEDGHGPDPDPE